MAQPWHSDVMAAYRAGGMQVFNFVDILVDTPIYLTDYHADITIDSKLYTSAVLQSVETPPRTGGINQDLQKISVVEALNGFTSADFISALGDNFYNATVIIVTRVVSVAGVLLTGSDQNLTRNEGLLKQPYRKPGEVILDITNSYGQLDMKKELRTTRGSLQRFDPTDTTFDKADAVDDNVALEWGT